LLVLRYSVLDNDCRALTAFVWLADWTLPYNLLLFLEVTSSMLAAFLLAPWLLLFFWLARYWQLLAGGGAVGCLQPRGSGALLPALRVEAPKLPKLR
jgi:hypothetical protein